MGFVYAFRIPGGDPGLGLRFLENFGLGVLYKCPPKRCYHNFIKTLETLSLGFRV